MANKVEVFFDKLASSWDEKESHSKEEKEYLLDLVGIAKNDKVIDIACGTGVITSLIHEYSKNDVLGVDISSEMIKIAKQKYKDEKYASFICGDILSLDFNDKFDVAIIYNAYPHFDDPVKLAKKLSEILNKNGRFAILHSLSKEELDKHHECVPSDISRSLKNASEEANNFKEFFNIVVTKETTHSYAIVGQKK